MDGFSEVVGKNLRSSPSNSTDKFETYKRAQAPYEWPGPCHHKPTPAINRLGWAARDQTVIDFSVQVSNSSALHCECRINPGGEALVLQNGRVGK